MKTPRPDAAALARFDALQRTRYDQRLEKFGDDPRALGWGDAAQQAARFTMVGRAIELAGKVVLDVGCGFGDLLDHLRAHGSAPARYLGWDINPRLLEVARARHPDAELAVRNLLAEPPAEPVADVVVAIGVFNLRSQELAPDSLLLGFLDAALGAAREAVVVNGISAVRDPGYPEEPVIAYRDPGWLLGEALARTPYVDLLHSFPSIPQREFVLVLRKAARP